MESDYTAKQSLSGFNERNTWKTAAGGDCGWSNFLFQSISLLTFGQLNGTINSSIYAENTYFHWASGRFPSNEEDAQVAQMKQFGKQF